MSIVARLVAAAQVEVDGMTVEQIDLLSRRLDICPEEHCVWQETKSFAGASGKITLEAAAELFELIGGTPNVFNSRSLAAKIAVTRIMAVLLVWKRSL